MRCREREREGDGGGGVGGVGDGREDMCLHSAASSPPDIRRDGSGSANKAVSVRKAPAF